LAVRIELSMWGLGGSLRASKNGSAINQIWAVSGGSAPVIVCSPELLVALVLLRACNTKSRLATVNVLPRPKSIPPLLMVLEPSSFLALKKPPILPTKGGDMEEALELASRIEKKHTKMKSALFRRSLHGHVPLTTSALHPPARRQLSACPGVL
jgi:hypothetical protein